MACPGVATGTQQRISLHEALTESNKAAQASPWTVQRQLSRRKLMAVARGPKKPQPWHRRPYAHPVRCFQDGLQIRDGVSALNLGDHLDVSAFSCTHPSQTRASLSPSQEGTSPFPRTHRHQSTASVRSSQRQPGHGLGQVLRGDTSAPRGSCHEAHVWIWAPTKDIWGWRGTRTRPPHSTLLLAFHCTSQAAGAQMDAHARPQKLS